MYTLRKYHSLLTTYARIAPQHREAFIQHMGEEMGRLIRAGEYDRKAFTAYEWNRLTMIICEPLTYHGVCVSGCSHLLAARIVGRLKKCRMLPWLICKADRLLNHAQIVLAWAAYEGPVRAIRRVKWKYTADCVNKEVTYG